jgi:hypothetical protein
VTDSKELERKFLFTYKRRNNDLIGGKGDNEGHGIAVDSLGNAYFTGFTESLNFRWWIRFE